MKIFNGFNLGFDEYSEDASSGFIAEVIAKNALDLMVICDGTCILQAQPLHKTGYRKWQSTHRLQLKIDF